jgi:hypothetical protein
MEAIYVAMEASKRMERRSRTLISAAVLAFLLVLAVSFSLAPVSSSGLLAQPVNPLINSTKGKSPGALVNITGPTNPNKSPVQTGNYTGPYRSGPTSTYPGSWTCGCGCYGVPEYVTTQVSLNLNISQALDHIDLETVYEAVIASPQFVQLSSGHGWVVSSWNAAEDFSSSTGLADMAIGLFVLTTNNAPDGYVFTYYNLLNGNVTVLYQQYLMFSCPAMMP